MARARIQQDAGGCSGPSPIKRAMCFRLAMGLCLGVPLWGCIVPAPGGESPTGGVSERSRAVVSSLPPLDVKLGANLENKIEVVGAKVEPGRILSGETAKMTLLFR